MRAILQHLLEFFKEHPGGKAAHDSEITCKGAGRAARKALEMMGVKGRGQPPLPLAAPGADFEVCTGKVEDYVYAPLAA